MLPCFAVRDRVGEREIAKPLQNPARDNICKGYRLTVGFCGRVEADELMGSLKLAHCIKMLRPALGPVIKHIWLSNKNKKIFMFG